MLKQLMKSGHFLVKPE